MAFDIPVARKAVEDCMGGAVDMARHIHAEISVGYPRTLRERIHLHDTLVGLVGMLGRHRDIEKASANATAERSSTIAHQQAVDLLEHASMLAAAEFLLSHVDRVGISRSHMDIAGENRALLSEATCLVRHILEHQRVPTTPVNPASSERTGAGWRTPFGGGIIEPSAASNQGARGDINPGQALFADAWPSIS
jgi:hypothetical protein